MEINYFIKGLIIGFSIAAPVGPIGILTIDRSLKFGPTAGLATGLGAATADAVYGCVAGFGHCRRQCELTRLNWKHGYLPQQDSVVGNDVCFRVLVKGRSDRVTSNRSCWIRKPQQMK